MPRGPGWVVRVSPKELSKGACVPSLGAPYTLPALWPPNHYPSPGGTMRILWLILAAALLARIIEAAAL